MDPILNYLRYDTVPTDQKEVRKLIYEGDNYTFIYDMLYKGGFNFPYLRCLQPEEGWRTLQDLHSGECSNHIKSLLLCIRVLCLGYYWPTMKDDAKDLVQRYSQCQKHTLIP